MSVVTCSNCGQPLQEAMYLPPGRYLCFDRTACNARVEVRRREALEPVLKSSVDADVEVSDYARGRIMAFFDEMEAILVDSAMPLEVTVKRWMK